MKNLPILAVIGAGKASEEVLMMAEEVGREIAEAHCHLVSGGRGGVMEAACRGHREGRSASSRAQTIGILPGSHASEANDYVDIVIPSGIGVARNAIVVSTGHGVIAIAGGSGTLSEMALAWQLGRARVAARPPSRRDESLWWLGQGAGRTQDRRQA
jgi:uncharacterized protein (TIGR00725 family)